METRSLRRDTLAEDTGSRVLLFGTSLRLLLQQVARSVVPGPISPHGLVHGGPAFHLCGPKSIRAAPRPSRREDTCTRLTPRLALARKNMGPSARYALKAAAAYFSSR